MTISKYSTSSFDPKLPAVNDSFEMLGLKASDPKKDHSSFVVHIIRSTSRGGDMGIAGSCVRWWFELASRVVQAAHRQAAVCLGCLLTLAVAVAQNVQPVPRLHARVTDLTDTLNAHQLQTLESELAALERRKGSQIGVLIVPTTQPEDIAPYAIRVFDEWKLGRKGIDDGVLLVVAKDDHRVRIEIARGLEGAIPDAAVARIIREYITPKFRVGDFYDGIHDATDALTKLIDGEPLPARSERRYVNLLALAVFGFFFAFIARLLFASKGVRLAIRAPIMLGGYGAAIWWLTQTAGKPLSYTLAAIVIGAAYTFLVALIPIAGSRGYRGNGGYGSSGGSSSSSGGSSGSSSSSSGTGFSGGGGDSAGGGASGNW